MTDHQLQLEIESLEGQLEGLRKSNVSQDEIQELLQVLAAKHQALAQALSTDHPINKTNEDEVEIIADAYLDWATASKRAGNVENCFQAHCQRMKLIPRLYYTEGIRILGRFDKTSHQSLEEETMSSDTLSLGIQELMPPEGIFQVEKKEMSATRWFPSSSAIEIGLEVRNLLVSHKYTQQQCVKRLVQEQLLDRQSAVLALNASRFFDTRQQFVHLVQPSHKEHASMYGSTVLMLLFLCGLAMHRADLIQWLGQDDMDTLIRASLLRPHGAEPSLDLLVPQVMIYPLGTLDFEPTPSDTGGSYPCFFVTDWPVESLLPTRDAIMSIGDDTLELMALTASHQTIVHQGRLLDMCCGSGIQGIYAWCCGGSSGWKTLVFSDINERAMNFVTANMALNGIQSESAYAIMGDLFDSLASKESPPSFDRICSNPPFVPDAYASTSNTVDPLIPARFAVGGSSDGMDVLRKVFATCFEHLHDQSTIHMVTELPNVEDSCDWIQEMLPKTVSLRLRIAYVVADVESIEEYALVREQESGERISIARSWATGLSESNTIRNRALVLLTIGPLQGDDPSRLYGYEFANDGTPESDEDAFLMKDGVDYIRQVLL